MVAVQKVCAESPTKVWSAASTVSLSDVCFGHSHPVPSVSLGMPLTSSPSCQWTEFGKVKGGCFWDLIPMELISNLALLSLPLSSTCSEGSQVHVSSCLRERDSWGKELNWGLTSEKSKVLSGYEWTRKHILSFNTHVFMTESPSELLTAVRGIQLSSPRLLTHRNGDINDCCLKLLNFREMHLRKGDNNSKKPGFGNHWQIWVKCKKRGRVQSPKCLSGKTSIIWFSWSITMAPPCLSPRI